MIIRKILLPLLSVLAFGTAAEARVEIELDLTHQKAYLIQDGDIVYTSTISSGRSNHPTPTGQFKVTEKDEDHRSSLYGKIVDSRGRTVKAEADHEDPVPSGGRFVQAPMRYFLRFNGAIGMHAGILPGYPASHGCVRLPAGKAALFYNVTEVGTPVRVYGKAPGRSQRSTKRSVTREQPEPRIVEEEYAPEPQFIRRRAPFFRRIF